MAANPDSNSTPSPRDPYAAIRYKPFRYFLYTRICMTLAFLILDILIYWQVYEQYPHEPKYVGYLGLLEALPQITVALFAGHLADKGSRKLIALNSLIAVSLCVAALFILTIRPGFIAGPYGLPSVYGLVFVIGFGRGLMSPALFGLQGQVVPREHYANATTWGTTVWHTGAVAGPALGGLAYAQFGLHYTYALSLLFLVCSIVSLMLVKETPYARTGKRESLGESLSSGIKFVFRNQIILSAISLDLFAVLFGGAIALLPYFSDNILHVGPQGLGLLRAAQPVGAVIMAALLIYFPMAKNAGWNLLFSVAGFGLCMVGFAYSTSFILSFALLAISGMLDNVSVVIRSTIIQLLTPDDMRGRVSAVNSIFIGSSNEIGAFESGIAAQWLGYVPSVIFGGFMTILVVIISGLSAPRLRILNLNSLTLKKVEEKPATEGAA